MALAKRLKELLEALEMDLETYLEKPTSSLRPWIPATWPRMAEHILQSSSTTATAATSAATASARSKENPAPGEKKRQKPCSQRPVQGGGGRRRQFVRAVGVQLRVQALRQTPACAARFRGALAAPYPVYRCPYPFTCV